MKIYVSKSLIEALNNLSDEERNQFVHKANELGRVSKKDIVSSEKIVKLDKSNKDSLYAYNIEKSFYIIFGIKDSKSLILVDRVELSDSNVIYSLVYGDKI